MTVFQRLSGLFIPLAAVVSALLIVALGADPIVGYRELVTGAFGDGDALVDTAVRAMPLLLVGASCRSATPGSD